MFHNLSVQFVSCAIEPEFQLFFFQVVARVSGVRAVYLGPPCRGHENGCLYDGLWVGYVSGLQSACLAYSFEQVLVFVECRLVQESFGDLCVVEVGYPFVGGIVQVSIQGCRCREGVVGGGLGDGRSWAGLFDGNTGTLEGEDVCRVVAACRCANVFRLFFVHERWGADGSVWGPRGLSMFVCRGGCSVRVEAVVVFLDF